MRKRITRGVKSMEGGSHVEMLWEGIRNVKTYTIRMETWLLMKEQVIR
jgi:hypothetical protein